MSTTRGRGGVCGAEEDNVTQHVFRHGRPQDVPRELTTGFLGVDARSTFEHLQVAAWNAHAARGEKKHGLHEFYG